MALNFFSLLILVICIIYIFIVLQQLFDIYIKDIVEECLNRNRELERRAKIKENKINKEKEEEEERFKELIGKYVSKYLEDFNKEATTHFEE